MVKGSQVNIVGRVRNSYPAADGGAVYALAFTGEEMWYFRTVHGRFEADLSV